MSTGTDNKFVMEDSTGVNIYADLTVFTFKLDIPHMEKLNLRVSSLGIVMN